MTLGLSHFAVTRFRGFINLTDGGLIRAELLDTPITLSTLASTDYAAHNEDVELEAEHYRGQTIQLDHAGNRCTTSVTSCGAMYRER